MRPALPHPAPDERGFILVGVITFMLALTILGLSLFALSSYEAQFFVASTAREQSLQNSESGMELVKALLAAPGSRLEYAHRAEGQMGVTSALAYQQRSADPNDTTSSGGVDWDSTLVIVVAAKSGGVERTLQARYIPGVTEDPYKRLLAAGMGVSVNTKNGTDASTLQLSGRVWQPVAAGADTAWTGFVEWNQGGPIERGMPPTPIGDAFVDDHVAQGLADPSAGTDLSSPSNGYEIHFQGSPSSPIFFHSPATPADAQGDNLAKLYSFYVNDDLDIKVQGVAVWVVQQGACFKKQVNVHAIDPNSNIPSTLVIVAKANLLDPGRENRGLWFRGGLTVDVQNGVHVYLVSQGDVSVIEDKDEEETNHAGGVSIVAGGRIEIGGPQTGHELDLTYDAPAMDGLADDLFATGALPTLMGGTGANFVVARQTWLEITPR